MTAAEMAAADFYDALKADNLQGLCIATDNEHGYTCRGIFTTPDDAASLIGVMISALAKEYSTDEESALVAVILHCVRSTNYYRTGEIPTTPQLTDNESKILDDIRRRIKVLTNLPAVLQKNLRLVRRETGEVYPVIEIGRAKNGKNDTDGTGGV